MRAYSLCTIGDISECYMEQFWVGVIRRLGSIHDYIYTLSPLKVKACNDIENVLVDTGAQALVISIKHFTY